MKRTQASLQKASSIKLKPIHKSSISDKIVQQLIALISSGELKAGQRLPSERELCVRFGAGRSSLREALRCLSIMGVLTSRVGDGTSVAMDGNKFLETVLRWRMSTQQHKIEDLMQVRIALEGIGCEAAAINADETDLKNLEALMTKMENVANEPKRFAALDLEFHLALARSSKNKLLLDLITLIRGQLERGVVRVLQTENAIPLSINEHRNVLAAVMARHPEKAHEAMNVHLKRAVWRYWSSISE